LFIEALKMAFEKVDNYRGKCLEYQLSFTALSWEEGLKVLAMEHVTFKVGNKVTIHDGLFVWNYKCPCGVRGRLESLPDKSAEFFISHPHTVACQNASDEPARGLSELQKYWVQKLYDENYSTVGRCEKRLLQLRASKRLPDGFLIPDKPRLRNFWRTLKKSTWIAAAELVPTPASFAEFAAANDQHSATEADVMFVCGFELLTEHGGEPQFRMCLSTLRLLSFVKTSSPLSNSMHGDDTNCVYMGFPVSIIGHTDKHRQFHAVMIQISSGKTGEDYRFLWATYRKWRSDMLIKYCIADGAAAIYNGLCKAQGDRDATRIMCWMHAFIKNFSDKTVRKIGFADIAAPEDAWKRVNRKHWKVKCVIHMKLVHQCTTEAMFNLALELWKNEYVTKMPDTKIKQVSALGIIIRVFATC
jgi:hypothetical protein